MKIVISEPGYTEIEPLEIDLGCRDVTLSGVYNGIGIETDQGCFGIAQRDGGLEVVLEGKLVWSSTDDFEEQEELEWPYPPVDAGAGAGAVGGRDRNPSTPSPDILTVPDMMGLEHQVDAGAVPLAEGEECIHLQYGVPHRIADKLELLMAFLNGKACGTFNLHTIGRGAAEMLPHGFVPFWTVILREDELVQLKDAVQNMLFHYHAQKMLEEHQEDAGAEGGDECEKP